MTSLDRLKGTDLLIHGFESFLQFWMSPEKALDTRFPEDGESSQIFNRLPKEVREFYQVVYRWPNSKISDDKGQDELISALRMKREWIPIIAENQDVFCIFASARRDDTLYIPLWEEGTWNPLDFEDDELIPLQVPMAEFLVCFGLRELIFKNWKSSEFDGKELIDQSVLLFSSTYVGNEDNRFYYHPNGTFWLESPYGEWAVIRED